MDTRRRRSIKQAPLYAVSVGLCCFLSAVGSIASLFAGPADRVPLAFAGLVGFLVSLLGLMDGPLPAPTDDD